MAAELQEISQAELVGRIKAADTEAIGEFYRRFIRGLTYFLCRRGGANYGDIEDLAHETIFLVVRGIQKGGLENPECLAGFVRTVALRLVYARWKEASRVATIPDNEAVWDQSHLIPEQQAISQKFSTQSGLNPEQQVLAKEKSAIFRQALARLKPKEVEILTRFYLNEQPHEAIQAEMGMSATQFRLNKSRAKARLAKEVARISSALPIPPIRPDRENLAA